MEIIEEKLTIEILIKKLFDTKRNKAKEKHEKLLNIVKENKK